MDFKLLLEMVMEKCAQLDTADGKIKIRGFDKVFTFKDLLCNI